ncbi:MAG: DUF86 domain-containing protein [Vulcanisaeta sp.]
MNSNIGLNARRPSGYSEVGYVLHELGIIDKEDADLMKSLAGLRNMLVHEYAVIDRASDYSGTISQDIMRITNKIINRVKGKGINDPVVDVDIHNVIGKLRLTLDGKVKAAFLFGGRSKGYVLRGDYDIGVLMEPGCDLYRLGTLQVDIAKALGVDEELVNLVCINDSPPALVLEILDGIPVLDVDDYLVFTLRFRALKELLDLNEDIHIVSRMLVG